jgi:uncharacterized protein
VSPRDPDHEPVLLLPPSEGKAEGGRVRMRAGTFARALHAPRVAVAEAFAAVAGEADDRTAAKAFGVTGERLDRARLCAIDIAAGRAPLLPAADRYTGVVWEHLGPLSDADRSRVLVPSAVYGITTAADPVADHRGKLTATLPVVGRLDRCWRTPVTTVLARRFRGRVVVDLLPQEHAAMIDWEQLGRAADVVHVEFLRADGAGAAGHAAKAAKGRFARTLLDGGLARASRFTWEGWRASPTDGGVTVLSPE